MMRERGALDLEPPGNCVPMSQNDSGSDSDQPARENTKPRGNGVFSAEELANLSIGNGKAKPAPKQPKKPKVSGASCLPRCTSVVATKWAEAASGLQCTLFLTPFLHWKLTAVYASGQEGEGVC
jgi:hypothetical protein